MSALSASPRFNKRRPSRRAVPALSAGCCAKAASGATENTTVTKRTINFFVQLISHPFRMHEDLLAAEAQSHKSFLCFLLWLTYELDRVSRPGLSVVTRPS